MKSKDRLLGASRRRAALIWASALIASSFYLPLCAAEYYDSYDLAPREDTVDLGVQPNAYPLAFISSVMMNDRIMVRDLKKLGVTPRFFRYKKGNDVFPFLGDGKLEMAFLGDMPTVNAIARTPTVVIGLGKRNFSSVVSRNYSRLDELRGKKIGYSAGSSSHLVLLRGLEAAKVSEKDITLVTLDPGQMPDALEDGSVDAYSAWEPTPSISFERNPRNKAIYRGMSTDWLVFSRDFAEKKPLTAAVLVAAYVRAINWMRQKSDYRALAADWVLADSQAFNGAPAKLSKAKAIDIVRKDLLDVPGAPAIPAMVDGLPPMSREFAFLKAQGKIAAQLDEAVVRQAFSYDLLKRVQSDPKRFQLFSFDYGN